MKKIIVALSALVLALALAACGSPAQSSSSSSASLSASGSSASSSASSASAVKWTDASTAADAAKGAGLAIFGAPDSIVIDDIQFANAKFGYTIGAAQAIYEQGAAQLGLRKSVDSHASVLSDKDVSQYAANWKKTYEGFEVTCYGPARGAISFATWLDGDNHYGAYLLGLGGDELTMDEEDIDDIVKAMVAANAPAPAAPAPVASSGAAAPSSGSSPAPAYIGEQAAKDTAVAALGLGLPREVVAQLVTGGDAPHYVVTLTYDNETRTVELDAYTGEVWSTGGDSASSGGDAASNGGGVAISAEDAKELARSAADAGLPESIVADFVDGTEPYYLVTITSDGESKSFIVDANTGAVQ